MMGDDGHTLFSACWHLHLGLHCMDVFCFFLAGYPAMGEYVVVMSWMGTPGLFLIGLDGFFFFFFHCNWQHFCMG